MTLSAEKILLVDDEPRLLTALKRRLSTEFVVETALNGNEALAILENDDQIALIIADMQMPGMNGIELLQQVRRRWPEVRRVMLTGNSDQDTAMAAINDGHVMRFLRKPTEFVELRRAINHALDDYSFARGGDETATAEKPDEKARKAFMSIISHELRTPLTHIIGLSSILQEMVAAGQTDLSEAYLGHIRTSGEELLSLLNRVLFYTRIISSTVHEPLVAVSVAACLKDAIQPYRGEIAKRNISLSIDCQHDGVTFLARADEVVMALREIISNAVKFNRNGGHISVIVHEDETNVSLRIADTGVGMPESTVARAMEPFRQGDEELSRQFEGIGMGLSLAHAIANLNNGQLTVQSVHGEGTTVVITLERARAARQTAAA
ncbi:response regulator [Aquisalinus flavus]|uniref:histidine kinase n=1 Tax=Aquisalinus flavus TaxID=1526572 RepID=A0A8J2Y3J6_9PROT|nr:hybrid sensor histidine kinase/response regulator [Aquisalinus flavus]MBD0426686.1 hybrid sensor histidine kinase/response regulator [Aquisalinus flavus]UNE47776.1 HAMP domain-containing histidine kinase [Aquisalinus flavus]GGD05842.1 hybrid sensor histidine kinase/response regulator [Aquisalinus flavus]